MNERRLGWIIAAVVLVFFNLSILQKEAQLRGGESLYFELAPVDPRSLMQGDYMRLDYVVARDAEPVVGSGRRGKIVVTVNERGVVSFIRDGSEPAQPAERVVRWKRKRRSLVVGADAYYFQEGRREHFERARYAELKVDDDGKALLVGLRDETLHPL